MRWSPVVVILSFVAACKGGDQPKSGKESVDPPPVATSKVAQELRAERAKFLTVASADAPFVIDGVSARQGTQPSMLARFPGRSYLEVAFTIAAPRPFTEEATLFVKATCQVGDRFLTDRANVMVDPRALQPGDAPRAETADVFLTGGFVGTASRCELWWYFDPQEPGTSPTRFDLRCWDGHAVAAGPCGFALPPTPAIRFGVANPQLVLDPTQLVYGYDLTVGAEIVGDEQLAIEASCQLGGTAAVDGGRVNASFSYAQIGETERVDGALFASGALTVQPRACEVTLTVRPQVSGAPFELARHCVRDGAVTTGACP